MSSHYEPIPNDSDHENNYVPETTPMSEDEGRTERARSADRYHFFQGGPADSEEEPEEENPPDTDHRAPLPTANSETRPLMRQTARIRAAMPNAQQRNQPQPSAPPTDPYDPYALNMSIWGRTLRTLQRWRDRMHYTPIPSENGSSSVRQEFLLDTTPIMVDKLTHHEERLDMVEDVIMDLPGHEQLGELQYQVDNADDNIAYVNSNVQDLKKQMETMTRKFQELETDVKEMKHEVGECHKMTALAHGMAQTSLRDFLKDGGK